jgi:hypothetical protein
MAKNLLHVTISKNIAADIAEKCSADSVSAVTLEYGYAIHSDGTRTLFEPARVLLIKRDKYDRCTKLVVQYSDQSKLEFTWSEKRIPEYKYKEVK